LQLASYSLALIDAVSMPELLHFTITGQRFHREL